MDAKDIITLVGAIVGGSSGLGALFYLVVKTNSGIKEKDSEWIRNNAFTKEDWLREKAIYDKQLLDANMEIRQLRTELEAIKDEKEQLADDNALMKQRWEELTLRMGALLHKLTNMEGYAIIQADVEELERELRNEQK